MSTEINWNQVVAAVFVDLTKTVLKGASQKVSDAFLVLLAAIQKDFEPYLCATLKRCSSIRTLLHRENLSRSPIYT